MSLIYANCMDITLLAWGVKMQVVPKVSYVQGLSFNKTLKSWIITK